MAATDKDTIYIDIDDEITAIIDKVRGSSSKVVALVLPKRATTLQSIVNMKLLKRSADQANKNLVLITTESGLMPLAGAVGLHVAKTPSSRPEIPSSADSPDALADEESVNFDDDEVEPATAQNAGNTAVGVLAGATAAAAIERPPVDSGIETVELDNEDKAAAGAAAPAAAAASKAKKPKKNKKLAVPDFDKFKMILIFGSLGLVLLVVLLYVGFVVMPKAVINVSTNASNVNTNVDFTLSTTTTALNASKNIVPAKQSQTQKTLTGTAPATGQKNNGDKATGNVTITLAGCGKNSVTIPAGTGVSSNGMTYVTGSTVTLESVSIGGKCNPPAYASEYSDTVKVTAQQGGLKYNIASGTTMTVSSGQGYNSSDVKATSGAIDGGTDDIQTVVSQADIDAAKGKITNTDSTAQEELNDQLKSQGLYPIVATYGSTTSAASNSSAVGSAASSVTVTQTVTYTMLGAKESDIETLVNNDIKTQIDTNNQSILSTGITQGSFKMKSTDASGTKMNIQTVAEVGPDLDTAKIASDAAGKKSSVIKSDIESNPDVTEVTVTLTPFWVSKAPKNVDKITVNIAKPTKTANAN